MSATVNVNGRITGDRDATIGCVVRYSSPTGANLEFDKDAVGDVPARFFFHTSDWDDGKDCPVIWRMGSLIGVEYKREDEPEV